MQSITHTTMRTDDSTGFPEISAPNHTSGKLQRTATHDPGSIIEALDAIFSNMRIHRISMGTCHAIVKLYIASTNKNELINLSSLASQLGVTTAATTSVADTIEKLGFAKRLVDPNDRRAIMISLTPRGLRFAESFGAIAPLSFGNNPVKRHSARRDGGSAQPIASNA